MNTATILLSTLAANRPSRQDGSPQLTPDGAGTTPLVIPAGTANASVTPFEQQLFNLCNPVQPANPPIPTAGEAHPEQPAPIDQELDIHWQIMAMLALANPGENPLTMNTAAESGTPMAATDAAQAAMLADAPKTIVPGTHPSAPFSQPMAQAPEMPVLMQTAAALVMPQQGGANPVSDPKPQDAQSTPLANPGLQSLLHAIVPQSPDNAQPPPSPAPNAQTMPLPAAVAAAIMAQAPAANGQKDGHASPSQPASLVNGTPAIEINPFPTSPTGNSPGQTLGQMTSGTTTTAEPATVDANRLLEQFDQLVLRTLRTDNKTLRVELHPASMGRMVLQCRETTSGLSIQLDVQNSDIRSLLTNEEHSLRNALQNKGIQVGQFSVSTQDRQDSASGNPSDRQHASLPQPARTMNFPGATPAAAPATAAHHYRQRYSRWVA